jgi:hypothetical protein
MGEAITTSKASQRKQHFWEDLKEEFKFDRGGEANQLEDIMNKETKPEIAHRAQ